MAFTMVRYLDKVKPAVKTDILASLRIIVQVHINAVLPHKTKIQKLSSNKELKEDCEALLNILEGRRYKLFVFSLINALFL